MVKPDAKSGNFRPRRYAGCSVSLHAQAWQVAFKEHGYYIPYEQLLDTPTAEARGILGSLRSQTFTTSKSEPSL